MSVRDTKLYDLLGVEPTASQSEITKAFRKVQAPTFVTTEQLAGNEISSRQKSLTRGP